VGDGNKQGQRAAKQWMLGGLSIANGPELPLVILSNAAAQLPKSSHSELISAVSSELATTVGLIVPDKSCAGRVVLLRPLRRIFSLVLKIV
jgi:hypothetical protein